MVCSSALPIPPFVKFYVPVIFGFLAVSIASAAPLSIDIKNPSFEEQKTTLNGDGDALPIGSDPGDYTAAVVPQWAAVSAGLFNPDQPLNFSPDSTLLAYMDDNSSLTQALKFPGGALVTASGGARLTVSMKARPRTAGTSNLTFDARVGGVSVATAATPFSLAANATGYATVTATVTLKDAAGLGAAAGQQISLVIGNTGTQANIDLVSASIIYPPAITSLSANPSPAAPGQAVTISWNVANATSLSFNGSDVTGLTSTVLTAPAVPQSYAFTATNADGSVSRSILVDVLPAALPLPTVRINEVVTENITGLTDEDGSHQDWIELYNTGSTAVDLTGYHLTDDRALPLKWTFPATSIPAGAYLTVFASAKNRATTPLHTNFKLDNDGEYLELTNAAGATVSTLSVPALTADKSYGYGTGPTRGLTNLSPSNSSLKWTIPTGTVSDAWRGGSAFNDTAWTAGQWDLGFNATTTVAYNIAASTVGTQSYAGALGMDFDALRPVQITELGCFDSGSNGLSRNITVVLWSRNQNGTTASTADDTQGSVLATLDFTTAVPGTLMGGQRFKTLAAPVNLPIGSYTILAYNYGTGEPNGNSSALNTGTNTGGGALQFVGASRYGVTSPPASPAASWPGSPDGGPAARYGSGTFRFKETTAFATNTQTAMSNVNATVLTRTAFTVAPGQIPQCPTLSVTYDDGFVAWLNGVEIVRRNAPAALSFNSSATAAANTTTTFPLAAYTNIFQTGTNILAVQGLNVAATDLDFRLQASISAGTSGEITAYLNSATPNAVNTAGQSTAGIVINEINSDPIDSKSRFTEFVELFNPLDTDVNVGGWQITGGISYLIPSGTIIPACGHLVIAENPSHLTTYLGYTSALGPWTGGLKNSGDDIVLRRPDLSVVDRVTYELGFPWPTVGDDPGDSMQRINERLDSNLGASWRSALPTPGARNSITSAVAPPAIRQIAHTPNAPTSGQSVVVRAKITDPDGIAAAWLEYQIVEPGNFIRLTDSAWTTNWITVPMTDDGTRSDTFTVTIPGSVQQHRRLIRYRIRTWDGALNQIRVPYADDDCPNFAYFCYDGVPTWTGAVQPGITSTNTFSMTTMNKVRPWHLLSDAADVQNCQYNAAYNDGSYRFEAALVLEGKVYDHVHYRIKGQNSTFNTGKNKWKLRFNRGRYLKMPDDYGLTNSTVKTLNISSVPAPWAPWNRGLNGLDEAMAFRLSNLAGAPAPSTSYLQWRVIDGAVEQNPTNQYDSDLWGLYLAFENTDNNFKDEHGLPDGNIFRLQGTGAGNSLLGQGKGQVGDLSDLNTFISATTGYNKGGGSATVAPLVSAIQSEAWFRANVNLPEYYNWRAVTEAVNQTDRRELENVVYFRDPTDGRWQILPWDCDLLYEGFDRWGPQSVQTATDLLQYEQIARGLLHPAILTEFQNRSRELQDLLLNSDQAWKVVDEFLSIITDETPRVIPNGGSINDGFVEVERRRWDYNPINPVPPRANTATGNYYRTPFRIGNMTNGPFPQPYNRVLATGDFEGMVKWVKDFITTGDHGGGRLAKMANGEIKPFTLTTTSAIQIPNTPTITYTGPVGYPLNQLQFSSASFSSPNSQSYAAMQWRIGEISDPTVPGFVAGQPWKYEITGVWTPAASTSFTATANAPATGLIAGRTYRARVRHQDSLGRWSHWSAPVQFQAGAAAPGDLATNLVVSEIMYNPPAPEGSNAEFLELMNIHPTASLDLTGLQFTAGITFSFATGTQLAAGARILVVRNSIAFNAKYGSGLPVAGQFSGGLDNNGELLTLSLGGSTPLRSFRYETSSPWPSEPNNTGASLVLIAPQTNPDHADGRNWRSSLTPNPGTSDTTNFATWQAANTQFDPNADTDHDGLSAFMEYALGGQPTISSQAPLPTLDRQPDGSATLTFTKPLTADDIAWQLQSCSDLTSWQPATATLLQRSATAGNETFSYSIPTAEFNETRRFWRVRFESR
jgi:hypothetical protein